VLLALSLIGVPPLPGFWAKILVLVGLAQGGSALDLLALIAILLVTAVEASYLFRVAVRLYQKGDSPPAGHSPWDLGVATALGAVLLVSTLGIVPLADSLRSVARQAGDAGLYVDTVFPATVAKKD
jgi:NADH:ubiquinone oxidoreductase subunit 2 (subunit N)